MFWKKKIVIEPKEVSETVLIQISSPAVIDKNVAITVPSRYKAIAFVDQKPAFRVEPCVNRNVINYYGKEYKGKQVRVAFIANKTFAQSPWGFGNIQINNERLKEAYRVGANGNYSIEILDHVKMLQAFPNFDIITMDQVREKTISVLKSTGTPLLAEYFTNTNISIFEITSLLGEFRTKFTDSLKNERLFSQMGIAISTLTVDGFHVNEEDLEMIRNRINE